MTSETFQPLGQTRDELLAEHERLEQRIVSLKRAREDIMHDLGEALRRAFILECRPADASREDGAA
jgi:hypothetical protein